MSAAAASAAAAAAAGIPNLSIFQMLIYASLSSSAKRIQFALSQWFMLHRANSLFDQA